MFHSPSSIDVVSLTIYALYLARIDVQVKCVLLGEGGRVLPYKTPMGTCRWMGRIFTTGLTIMGSHFQ